ncbi:MAG: peptidase S41 [Cyclobacteriaceae bacterium]|nr:peptidase S41 [Cyclobacteriaceae bacterium]
MKQLSHLFLILLLFPLIGFTQPDTLATKMLSPEQMQKDFNYLRRMLTETHPGLYRYLPKEKMQIKLDSVYQLLNKPLPFYSFYKSVLSVVADVRCAHTNALPTADLNRYIGNIRTFPFFLFPIDNNLYVIFNGSTDSQITLGYQLVQINGRSSESIMQTIKKHYWSDGYIEVSKNTALQGGSFCLFYYTLIERPDQFDVTFKDLNGNLYRSTVPAQKYGVTERAYTKNKINQKANQLYNQRHKQPWRLSFPADVPATALLRFDGFGGKGMTTSETARLGMKKFMDDVMKKIESKKCTNLIIDVRSNSGGWDIQGVELFTFLMKQDSAVRYYQKMHAITDSSEFLTYSDLSADDRKNLKQELKKEADGTFTLRQEVTAELQPQLPKANRFKGNIYILQNERSFSSAAEFLAACKTYQVGTLVGMESGGAYEGGNGASFIHVELPKSKIQIGSPLVYYSNATRGQFQIGRGTIPDHIVAVEPSDLVNNYDRQLEFVKKLISKKQE